MKFSLSEYILLISVCIFISSCGSVETEQSDFVKVDNGVFYIKNERYNYAGANYWQGMHLGSTKYGNREQLKRELDQLKMYGITNLRIMASCEADPDSKYCMQPPLMKAPGEYDENLWEGLDYLLDEMAKRDMKAVLVLSNFWTWSGGFSQFLKWDGAGDIPYPQEPEHGWWDYGQYTKAFFTNETTKEWYSNHVIETVKRTNSINGIKYTEDPTIMSWQLANEPRGMDNKKEFADWIRDTAGLIKSMDKNHLVSLGSEGNTPNPDEGLTAIIDNAYEAIDYITMHIWVQNWNWYTPGHGKEKYTEMIHRFDAYWNDHVEVARQLNKPLVLEEYGLARDAFNYDPVASVEERNNYYQYVYNKFVTNAHKAGAVQGVNFWAYSGEARPPRPGEYWQKGDVFVGDPPHELQGWYGVYNTDTTTLKLIQNQLGELRD
ncbi:MAG: cellulase family glycosylhydrolase [Bacteroidales bacterium]|nr:cellulase family glycosylhydrolase [Bacteroidales bacterium]